VKYRLGGTNSLPEKLVTVWSQNYAISHAFLTPSGYKANGIIGTYS
jgi:hypothetical protein